jgi:hypothetical protein
MNTVGTAIGSKPTTKTLPNEAALDVSNDANHISVPNSEQNEIFYGS